MLAQNLQFVDRQTALALFRDVASRRVYGNASGRRARAIATTAFERGFDAVERSAELLRVTISGSRLCFVPLFDEGARIEAVLVVDAPLESLPKILHEIQSPVRNFAQIIHILPQIVMTARSNGRIDYMSRRWYDVFDTARAHSDPHGSVFAVAVDSEELRPRECFEAGVATHDGFGFELQMRTARGARWFRLDAMPWRRDGVILKWSIVLTDVDESVTAHVALERSQQRLRLSSEVGRLLNTSSEPQAIATGLAERISTWCGRTVLVYARENQEEIARAAFPASESYPVDRIVADAVRMLAGPGQVAHGLSVFPVRGDLRLSGFIAVVEDATQGHHMQNDEEDARLMVDIAERLAIALADCVRHRREHRIANVLQRAMLPVSLPTVEGMRFDVSYVPAGESMLVGGDWYDAYVLKDGRVAVAIGDVAGHGLESAIVMSDMRRIIRAAIYDDPDPSSVLGRANAIARQESYPMTTAFVAVIDPLTLSVEYASAGHPPALVVGRDATSRELKLDGPPLGVSEHLKLKRRSETLDDGDAVVMYTDGLIEADRDILGSERRLQTLLQTWASEGFHANADDLQRRMIGTTGGPDDAALFIVRLEPLHALAFTFQASAQNSHRARIALERRLALLPLSPLRTKDFVLAVAEAMNNAAEHAYARELGMVRVRLSEERHQVVAEIQDDGSWHDATPSTDRGRGMDIMKALVDSFDVRTTQIGTSVRLGIDVESMPDPRLSNGKIGANSHPGQ